MDRPSPYEPVQARPRPLALAIVELPFLYLRALFPSARLFAAEGERASWGIVWIQILLLILIPGALGLVRGLTRDASIGAAANSQQLYDVLASLSVGTSIVATLIQVLIVPILFFIGVTIQFLLAKAFRGQGTYLAQSYTALLYQVPLTIIHSVITTVLLFLHVAGRLVISPVIGLALVIYSVLLNIEAIAGVHRLTKGRATAVVLIPYIVGALVACGLTIALARYIISALHGVR